jgi:putative MFS transporter
MASQGFLFQSERVTKRQWSAFIGAAVGWIFDYYEVFLLTFLVIPISREFKLSTQTTASLISLQLLFLAVGGILFGLLADRYGRQTILMWTIIIYTLGTLARAFTFTPGWLWVWTAVAALGIGGEYGVGQTLVSEVMPTRRRGWWSGLLYGGIYIGIMMGAIVGGYVAPLIGWRLTFALSALPVLLAIFVRVLAPESDVWRARTQRTGTNWALLARKTFLVPFVLCLVAGILQFFAYYGITTFLPTYLVKYQHFALGKAAWWLFFTAFAGLVGCAVGAYTSDRWGRRVTLSYLAGTAAVGGLILFAVWKSLLSSPWILVPFFLLYFGSNGATVFGALFSEVFPTDVRTTGVSSALQIARGLSFIPPLITAAIFPIYGYAPVVLIGAVEFGLLAIFAWVFHETRGKPITDIDVETLGVVSAPQATVPGAPA